MNRNDILRELELLPAWQLKAGFQVGVEVPHQVIETEQKVSLVNITTAPIIIEPVVIIAKQVVTVLVILNIPKTANFYASDAGILLDNMLKAIQLKRDENIVIVFDVDALQTYEAKLILALGEQVAQKTINISEPLSVLRGKLHQLNAMQVIVSHDLAHLLLQPSLKREAWQDLKLLKSSLNHL